MILEPLPDWIRIGGRISEVEPQLYHVTGLSQIACIGDYVRIEYGGQTELGVIVCIRESELLVKPTKVLHGVGVGTRVWYSGPLTISPSNGWKGRVINAMGEPLDDYGALPAGPSINPVIIEAPPSFERGLAGPAVRTGIRAIDVFAPLAVGQRIGIFSGSGVGKSTLLSMLTNTTEFDTIVLALVGERGREVREILQTVNLSGKANCLCVVSTADDSAVYRKMAPQTAMAAAEYFRNQGERVLLIIDSVTRFAQAAREIAITIGEPPAARGFPPSVFSDLSRLLERAGPGMAGQGSITGIFSVLVEGDDLHEPVSDAVRGILDGHVVLDRRIAEAGRYPAIDCLGSVSRLANIAWGEHELKLVHNLRRLISLYEESRDLRAMGGYVSGADKQLDAAVELVPQLYDHLTQVVPDQPEIDPYLAINGILGPALAPPADLAAS